MKKIIRELTENEYREIYESIPSMLASIVAARVWGCKLTDEEMIDIMPKLGEKFWSITRDTIKERVSFPEGVSIEINH